MAPEPVTALAPPLAEFSTDWRRWVLLSTFSAYSLSNAMQWITFAPVVSETKSFFGVTSFQVNMLSMVYAIVFAIIGFTGSAVLERFGLKYSLVLGAGLNVAGAVLRLVAPLAAPHYATIICAQFLNSLSQIFVLPIPPLIASQWFPEKERTLATSVAAMANSVGVALGMLIPPFLVQHAASHKLGFTYLFAVETALSSLPFLVTFALPQTPVAPPSAAASPQSRSSHPGSSSAPQPLHRQLKSLLLTRPSFRALLLVSAVALGSMWTLSTVLAQLMLPFGISETDAGWAGFASLIGGAIPGLGVGVFIDKRRVYKAPMTILLSLSGAFLVCMLLGMALAEQPAARWLGIVFYSLSGTALNGSIPIFFEYGIECTFPAAESISSTAIMVVANAVCVVFIFVASAVLGNDPSRTECVVSLIVFIVLLGASTAVLALTKAELRRLSFERGIASARCEHAPLTPYQILDPAQMSDDSNH